MDLGGTLWFLAVLGGITVLGLAFAYGVAQFNRRDRRLDPLRDQVTRQNYAADDREAEAAEGVPDRPTPPNLTPR
jgi:hypothetical protein